MPDALEATAQRPLDARLATGGDAADTVHYVIRRPAPPGGADRLYGGAVTVVAVALVITYAFLSSDLAESVRQVATFSGLILGGVAGALACAYRANRSVGRRQRAWRFIAAACGLGAVGNSLYVLGTYGVIGHQVANLSDACFLLAAIAGVVAILLFPTARHRGTDSARMVLDGVIVGGSILYMLSIGVFPQLLGESGVPLLERLPSLLLPVLEGVLATLAVLLMLRSRREDRSALALLSIGMVLYAASDLAYAVATAQGTFAFGSQTDLGWIAGYSLIALAALHPGASAPAAESADAQQETSPMWGTVLMFGLFTGATVLSLYQVTLGSLNPATGTMLIGVVVAVAARQILLIKDNDTLRLGLERRVSERTAELAKLTEQTELLLSSVGDGIYGVDRDGGVTFANPAALQILGYTSDELIGKPAHVTFHGRQPDGTPYPATLCYISEAIDAGIRTSSEEDTYLRRDGRQVPVEVTASPLTSDEGTIGAVVGFRDVTERREVDRMKSEFVSVVSHELRTPLTAIRGSLGLISGGAVGQLPSRAAHMVGIALESSERLTRLINDILDIERIEAGTTPMDVADHRAAELIDAAISQVQVLAQNDRVRIDVVAAEGAVHADRDRVVQALLNLIGNAIKFSPPETTIEVESVVDGDTVEFRVSDRGRGIPTDKLSSIFNRFEQVDSSDAREKGGTGLGLAISRSIVERHGGRIWAENRAGNGARFRFTLPRAVIRVDRPGARAERASVLVHGLDADVVTAVTRDLDTHGYGCLALTTAANVIAQSEKHRPAAIVLAADAAPPTAEALLKDLRENPETREVPVVVVSNQTPDRLPGLAASADGWVSAGASDDRLVRTIVTAVLGQRARGAVLVVEDDDDLADVIRALLERRGLMVHHARTKAEALSFCTFTSPNVLILDRVLPDGDAAEIIEALRHEERLAQVPVIIFSADEVQPHERDAHRLGRTVFLSKGRATPQQLEAYVVDLMGATLVQGDVDNVTRPSVRSRPAPATVAVGAGGSTPLGQRAR
jgi:PAS domain S-box-containing protein